MCVVTEIETVRLVPGTVRHAAVCEFRSHQMYYMFGFLFLVFIILIVTCSETAVLLCYFHLCAEVCQSRLGIYTARQNPEASLLRLACF